MRRSIGGCLKGAGMSCWISGWAISTIFHALVARPDILDSVGIDGSAEMLVLGLRCGLYASETNQTLADAPSQVVVEMSDDVGEACWADFSAAFSNSQHQTSSTFFSRRNIISPLSRPLLLCQIAQ